MPAVKFSKTGTAPEDTAWDWNSATQNAILGDSGDDWANYKAAHAWFDDADGSTPEKKAPYKLPHHRAGDGGLEAVWHGVSNAMARLSQADLPDADRKAVFDHLAAHYAQWDKTPPDYERFQAMVEIAAVRRQRLADPAQRSNLPMAATRAAIAVADVRAGGEPSEADLALINQFARTQLRADQVYVFPAQISTQSVDAYYTRMTPATLQRFADASNAGVAVCDSHQHQRLPIGRSYYGTVVDTSVGGQPMQATHAMGYMLRGMQTSSGMNTDDVIRGIEAGITNDVSVGFIPRAYWCSICGLNMMRDYDCMHWPGQFYEQKQPNGELREVQCVAEVDADLAEYSLVYDGATPGAMILKAEREMELGRANARLIAFVEDRCRVALMQRWQGFGQGAKQGGLIAPAGAAAGATPAPRVVTSNGTTALATPVAERQPEGDTDMNAAELIGGVIARAQEAATRGGKEISSANMQRLQAMHDQAREGHMTMDEALRAMGEFLAEKSAPADDAGDGDEGRAADAEPRTKASGKAGEAAGAKGKSSHSRKDGDGAEGEPDEDNGGENAADADDGDGDEGAETNASDDTSEPGTDDGDGDDDEPDKNPDAEESDQPTGSGKDEGGKSKKSAKRSAPVEVRMTVEAAMAALPEVREAVEFHARAKAQAVEEALAAGARALGDRFDADRYKAILERSTIDEACRFRDDWQTFARAALSPIGRFSPDPKAPGGGRWSDQPTMIGGRQTLARDPNDPAGMVPGMVAGAQTGKAQPGGVAADPSLYRTGTVRQGGARAARNTRKSQGR